MPIRKDTEVQHEPAPGPGTVTIKYKCTAGHDHELELPMQSAIVACRTVPQGDEDVKIVIMGPPQDHLLLHRAISHAMKEQVIPAMLEKLSETLKKLPGHEASDMMAKLVDLIMDDTVPLGQAMGKQEAWPTDFTTKGNNPLADSTTSDPISDILREIKRGKNKREDIS